MDEWHKLLEALPLTANERALAKDLIPEADQAWVLSMPAAEATGAIRMQMRMLQRQRLEATEVLAQPLPEMEYMPGKCSTSPYPKPPVTVEVWEGCFQLIKDWRKTLPPMTFWDLVMRQNAVPVCSERGICSMFHEHAMQKVSAVLKQLLRLSNVPHRNARWVEEPAKEEPWESAALAGTEADGARPKSSLKPVEGPLDFRKKPDFQLRNPTGPDQPLPTATMASFIEMKQPILLKLAETRSLACCFKEEEGRRPYERPSFAALPRVLGQVHFYARLYRITYFAISTYEVTWICHLNDKGELLISEGISRDSQDITALQALTWMSLQALADPPHAQQQPQLPAPPGGATPASAPSATGLDDRDTSIDHDAVDGGSSDGSGTSEGPQLELLVDPLEELGHGMTGTVWAGSLDGEPVAVKSCPLAKRQALEYEAHLYQTSLLHLQGQYVPRLLYAGLSPLRRAYCLVMARIRGRPMSRHDTDLLLLALAALRALHAAGLLHGDIRLDNFLVMKQAGTWLVKIIDFGMARAIRSKEEQEDEEQQLCSLLGVALEASSSTAHRCARDVASEAAGAGASPVQYSSSGFRGILPVDARPTRRQAQLHPSRAPTPRPRRIVMHTLSVLHGRSGAAAGGSLMPR